MGSIPKIVSTPLKWVSKKILHQTLLRFPGGDSHSPIACVYCPEMCRFSCPTAVVSGNDTVTPCNKMGLLYKEEKWPGELSRQTQLWPVYDCTGCGRCTEYCVYEMPVAKQLFEARAKFKWDWAEKLAAGLSDTEDPFGDLADELGDEVRARKRRPPQGSSVEGSLVEGSSVVSVSEPKVFYYLQNLGYSVSLSLETYLQAKTLPNFVADQLRGRTWLIHESVWHSRRMGEFDQIQKWLHSLTEAGIPFAQPFSHGRDCLDCGGEGAYSRLFPQQARQMAVEIWERDRERVNGILCISQRCAEHFRNSLRTGLSEPRVLVLSLEELWKNRGKNGGPES